MQGTEVINNGSTPDLHPHIDDWVDGLITNPALPPRQFIQTHLGRQLLIPCQTWLLLHPGHSVIYKLMILDNKFFFIQINLYNCHTCLKLFVRVRLNHFFNIPFLLFLSISVLIYMELIPLKAMTAI